MNEQSHVIVIGGGCAGVMAANRLTQRADVLGAGVVADALTWRDGVAGWPREPTADRSRVGEPDSVGLGLHGPGGAELFLVLHRGGWADVDYLGDADGIGAIPAPDRCGRSPNCSTRASPASSVSVTASGRHRRRSLRAGRGVPGPLPRPASSGG